LLSFSFVFPLDHFYADEEKGVRLEREKALTDDKQKRTFFLALDLPDFLAAPLAAWICLDLPPSFPLSFPASFLGGCVGEDKQLFKEMDQHAVVWYHCRGRGFWLQENKERSSSCRQ